MSFGVIFDLDGLLVNSEPLHKKAESELLNFLGCKGEELCRLTFGMKAEDAFLFLKENLKFPHSIAKVKKFWFSRIVSLFEKGVEFMPGAEQALKNVKAAGFKLGLCSSSPQKLIELVFNRFSLWDYFSAVVSGDEVKKGKPEAEIYLLCAQKLKLPPQNCLALEDSPLGVKAAKKAGMHCFAVPNPYTREFDFSPADRILNSLTELTPELVRKQLA